MLSLENIAIERGNKKLIHHLGLTVFPGSLIIVRGGNGIGKSTLLRTIAGLYRPTQGAIRWNEVLIEDEYDTYCSLITYLGHATMLKPSMTVREHLSFWGLLRQTIDMVPAALRYFGLDDMLDINCGNLSKGWQQRVALTMIMASKAMLWILDEPTTNLDQDGIDLLCNAISIRAQQGGIIIMASHADIPLQGATQLHLEDYQYRERGYLKYEA